MQNNSFYSNAKLLISGEYLVLNGAKALALPLKFGQSLNPKEKPSSSSKPLLYWKSYEKNLLWFELILSLPDFRLRETSDRLIAERLIKILKQAHLLNPNFIKKNTNYFVKTRMSFLKEWGLGSSSTLVNNIGEWTGVNPYLLLDKTFGGSGYDIACASSDQPIFFSRTDNKPSVEAIDFNPIFKHHLFFIYLGKKQISSDSIKQFKQIKSYSENTIQDITEISKEMLYAKTLVEFKKLMYSHEHIIANLLNKKRIREDLYSDFDGEIKSLGAWGGDFIMAATENSYKKTKQYFMEKGLNTIFKYTDLVIGY